ncbi:BREX-1 system phosphatase PglZ type B [Brachybacterium tyrofermentans]|uniref:BREX-1 system phosphatase PglZ type B n=1 Tax=Brachybacterium tyrofermentans TaxID=47848 RepID=UPI003FD0EBDB
MNGNLRATLAATLRQAATSGQHTVPPAAVLWADPAREWKSVVPVLRQDVPILTLDKYVPREGSGPALWIRAALAAPEAESVALPVGMAEHDDKIPWVIYMPGVRRSDLAGPGHVKSDLAPLVDVELRSVWWPSPASQDPWTPHSFLASRHGAGLDVAGDAKTRQVVADNLLRLMEEDLGALHAKGRLDADRILQIVMPDAVKHILGWISDPQHLEASAPMNQWTAFISRCNAEYGFTPGKDTPITAAGFLGARQGPWEQVWERYADNPARFPGVREMLDQARPQGLLFVSKAEDPHPESWPSWNTEQENLLREGLTGLAALPTEKACRERITTLATEHSERASTVWGQQGEAPLATFLGQLTRLAEAAAEAPDTSSTDAFAQWYAKTGVGVDRLALEARAETASGKDSVAITAALHAVYDPWADRVARQFQEVVAHDGYIGQTGLDVEAGTCVVYVDALRLDLAHRLAEILPEDHKAELAYRFAAYPSVTPTGQPAVAPIPFTVSNTWGPGDKFDVADAQGRSVKGEVFRKALTGTGVQYLEWKAGQTGDPAGIAWTQDTSIDSSGHNSTGAGLARAVGAALEALVDRISSLLQAGWRKVVIVTDHGFLFPGAEAPKVELSVNLLEGGRITARKPRTARLRQGVISPFPALPWTWGPDIDMVSPPGTAAFEVGVLYEHGGLSPQECVIPVVTVTDGAGSGGESAVAAQISKIAWKGQRAVVDFVPPDAPVLASIRYEPGDSKHPLGGPVDPISSGTARVLVSDPDVEGHDAYVVLTSEDGAVVAQQRTVVGGEE